MDHPGVVRWGPDAGSVVSTEARRSGWSAWSSGRRFVGCISSTDWGSGRSAGGRGCIGRRSVGRYGLRRRPRIRGRRGGQFSTGKLGGGPDFNRREWSTFRPALTGPSRPNGRIPIAFSLVVAPVEGCFEVALAALASFAYALGTTTRSSRYRRPAAAGLHLARGR
jgi:hypothetical protein